MALDLVEFVIAVEQAYQLPIPDEDAARITSPRRLINYIHGRLSHGRDSCCFSQRAFYAIRGVLSRRLDVPRNFLRPDTNLRSVLPENYRQVWTEIGETLGYSVWPHFRRDGWFERLFPGWEPRTIDKAASHIAVLLPSAFKPEGEGWTWIEVRGTVDALIRYQFGIGNYSLDDRFVQDLGVA